MHKIAVSAQIQQLSLKLTDRNTERRTVSGTLRTSGGRTPCISAPSPRHPSFAPPCAVINARNVPTVSASLFLALVGPSVLGTFSVKIRVGFASEACSCVLHMCGLHASSLPASMFLLAPSPSPSPSPADTVSLHPSITQPMTDNSCVHPASGHDPASERDPRGLPVQHLACGMTETFSPAPHPEDLGPPPPIAVQSRSNRTLRTLGK